MNNPYNLIFFSDLHFLRSPNDEGAILAHYKHGHLNDAKQVLNQQCFIGIPQYLHFLLHKCLNCHIIIFRCLDFTKKVEEYC